MALKTLMLRKKLDEKNKALAAIRSAAEELEKREAELEQSITEAETDEEKSAVEEAVAQFETDKAENEEQAANLEREIGEIEAEISESENKQEEARKAEPVKKEERTEKPTMTINTKRTYFGMTRSEAEEFVKRDEIKVLLDRIRELGKQKRAIQNVDLTIPTEMYDIIRENIDRYSKLISKVFKKNVSGKARELIMSGIPEAVWTEMCAAINELSIGLNMTEVDGYKVAGFFAICNATLEDSDLNLMSELVDALGQAIGFALDKAIVYGKGVKMPLGIVTRLAQTSQPSDYGTYDRTWVDLHTTNVRTLASGLTGVSLYQAILGASVYAKGNFSRGNLVWLMNKATFTNLQIQAMTVNASGTIVSSQTGTMPVVGGDIVKLEFIPDNNIIVGYLDDYLLAERADIAINRSTEVRFLEDQTVVKGTARYDGKPVIAEAFCVIGLNNTSPTTSVDFAPDKANPMTGVATLDSLTLSGITLSPTFDPATTSYTGSTTSGTATVTAVPTDKFDSIAIDVNGAYIPNGGKATWSAGSNTLTVAVKDSDSTTTKAYTVTITKS